jgi:hypothetical protein
MPLAHAKFFAEPREFTEEQIEELRAARLLRDEPLPSAPKPPITPPAVPPGATKENP